jgi:hypothetical protein
MNSSVVIYYKVNLVVYVTVFTLRTSSRIITSQLCNLSEDRLSLGGVKCKERLCTARQDCPDCFFVSLSKFHSSSQLGTCKDGVGDE